jgi:hypothetical protein
MTVDFPPLPPPFDVAATLVAVGGRARAWLTTPAGVVTQMAEGATMDADAARWLATEVTSTLRERASPGTRFRFVHDWRGVVRHDADARRLIIEWGLSFSRGEIERIDVLPPRSSSPLLAMAVSTGRMAMLAAGIRLDVVTDPTKALAGLSLSRR